MGTLNTFIETSHFKMESTHTVLNLATSYCWMASIDLRDAYYSVKIHPDFHKYLKFCYKGTQFSPMAYVSAQKLLLRR